MRTILTIVFAVVAVVLALAFSCPDEDSFHRFHKKASAREKGTLVEEATDAVLSSQERFTANYQDHTLWATVHTTRGGHQERYLGVMGIWLELGDG